MNAQIMENLVTEVKGEYDVIVVGCGVAGVSAAIAAKRAGVEKVLMLEKTITFGGLATAGLIALYEPLDDGAGDRVMGGLALELMEKSIEYGYSSLDQEWKGFPEKGPSKPRCESFFSPGIFSYVLDDLVRKEDVDVILEAHVVNTLMIDDECRYIVVETREGRAAYRARIFVDATGDSILLDRSGCRCVAGKNWLTSTYFQISLQSAKSSIEREDIYQLAQWKSVGADLWGRGQPEGIETVEGLTPEEVTWFVREGRRRVLERIKEDDPISRDIVSVPSIPQFRETRRIDGDFTVSEDCCNRRFDRSIGVCGDFFYPGRWYEVPFEALYSLSSKNIITCGRSISASGWAWDALREIPVCAMTGQAAGAAAALGVIAKKRFQDIPIQDIQRTLENQGVRIHK